MGGTLAPGRPNEHVLADVPGTWEPASVTGTLLPEGWGASAGYPAIVLDQQGPHVDGLVFTSPDLEEHWDRLDAFEGVGYVRRVAAATLADGRTVPAHVYTLRSD